MSRSLLCWALLTVCVAVASAEHGLVKIKGQVRTKSGQVAQVTKTADVDCRMEQVTTEEEDGSVRAVIKDFVTGKSVLLKSSAPDVCYVMDIPQDEMREQEENCLDGETLVKPGSTAGKERVYAEGDPVSPEGLSEELAEACQGRRLVTLQDVTDRTQNEGSSTQKRECHYYTTNVCGPHEVNCRSVCVRHGWWWSSDTCKRYETECDTVNDCRDQQTRVCSSG